MKKFNGLYWWVGLILMMGALIQAAMFIFTLTLGSKDQLSGGVTGFWITALVLGIASYFFFSLGGSKFNLKIVLVGVLAILAGFISEAVKSNIGGTIGELVSIGIKSGILIFGISYLIGFYLFPKKR